MGSALRFSAFRFYIVLSINDNFTGDLRNVPASLRPHWEHFEIDSFSLLFLATTDLEFGEGNGNPLLYSCLENPMDRGAWYTAVHGVAKSQTWLSEFTFHFHFPRSCIGEEMATHSSALAWRIPGTVEPGGLLSMGSHIVGHDWSDAAAAAAADLDFIFHSYIVKLQKQKHRGNIMMNSWVPATQLFILPMELDLALSDLCYTGLENTEVLWTLSSYRIALKEVKALPLLSSFFVAIQLLMPVIFYPNAVISRWFIFQSTFFFSFLFGTTLFLSHAYLEFTCALGAVMRSGVSLGTAKKTRAPDMCTSSFPEIPVTWSEAEGELKDGNCQA